MKNTSTKRFPKPGMLDTILLTRTDNNKGDVNLAALPKRRLDDRSNMCTCFTNSSFKWTDMTLLLSEKSSQASLDMTKPFGIGTLMRFISHKLAALAPNIVHITKSYHKQQVKPLPMK